MKRKLYTPFLIVLLVSIMAMSACAPASTPAPSPTPVHWTYEGEEGPVHWGELDSAYETCGKGKSQSPIDISSPSEQDLANIVFHYQPSKVNILNNGHTVQVNYDAGSYIELDGVRYNVAQFHYHAPSEHEVNGKLFAAELHIVHKSADGNLAVIGLLLQEGAENAAFEPFIQNLPAQKSDVKDAGVKINVFDLLVTCNDLCNTKTAIRLVTLLMRKTATTSVTHSTLRPTRSRNENKGCSAKGSRTIAFARRTQNRNR